MPQAASVELGSLRRACRSIKAFTLVELLVVIGIIALLISILLPALNKARAQANLLKCATQLREVGNAFRYYAGENRNFYPPAKLTPAAGVYAVDAFDFSPTYPAYWINFLNKYVTKNGTGAALRSAAEASDVKNRSVIWGCTNFEAYVSSGANAAAGFNVVQTGYGMNLFPYYSVDKQTATAVETAQNTTWGPANPSNGFIKATAWGKQSSSRMLVSESRYYIVLMYPPPTPIRNVAQPTYVGAQSGDAANQTTDTQASINFWRHGQQPTNEGTSGEFKYNVFKGRVAYNILYGDGHVGSSTDPKDAWRSTLMKF